MATASLVVRLSAQIAEFQRSFDEASKSTQKFQADFEGIATRAAAVGTFIGGIAKDMAYALVQGFGTGLRDAVKASSEMQSSLVGLDSIAAAFGHNLADVRAAATGLTADGLLPMKDAAAGLKNLLATGFSLDQATTLMNAFKDSAAFGRQGALSFGDAIRAATEGIKNGNSTLVDNAGLTKNLSNILVEAGYKATDLGRVQSDLSVRTALYTGLLKETNAQTGDAAKYAQTYAGQLSRVESAYTVLLATIGDSITTNATAQTLIKMVGDELLNLTSYLGTNQQGFNLVSEAVIWFAKTLTQTVHVINVTQKAFHEFVGGVNTAVGAVAGAFQILFKAAEKFHEIQKYTDPTAWQAHAKAAEEAGQAYVALDGFMGRLRTSTAEAEITSSRWDATLSAVESKLSNMTAELEKTRGKTVELATANTRVRETTEAAAAAAGKEKGFAKSLGDLTKEIDLAISKGTALPELVELFGKKAETATEKGRAFGIVVKQSVVDIATAYRDLATADFLRDFFDKQNKEWAKYTETQIKAVEQSVDRRNKAFTAGLDVEVAALRDHAKVLEAGEVDSLDKRLRAVRADTDDRRRLLDKNASNYQESLAIIDRLEAASADKATREWQEHVNETKKAVSGYGSIFGDALKGIPDLISKALTGGGGLKGGIGSIVSGLGSKLGGNLFGDLAAKMSNTLSSTFGVGVTSALGTIIPGIGSAIGALAGPLIDKISGLFGNKGRDTVKDFAASMGGFDALHVKLGEMGAAGEALWVKLTQGTGRNNAEQAAANVAEVQAALEAFGTPAERAEQRIAALGGAIEGVNAKAALFAAPFDALIAKMKDADDETDTFKAKLAAMGEAGQAEFERLGTFAGAAFAGMVKETGDAIGALDKLAPTFDVLKRGISEFGLTSTNTINELVASYDLVHDQVTGPIKSIAATGQIFTGLKDAGIMTGELFQTVATDIGASFRDLEAKGGDVARAMALSQPVLQKLWEAQQTYGAVTDETTAALLKQAEEQVLVGAQMKSVNDKILDVLLSIAEVFGAKIPDALKATTTAAQKATSGISDELGKIKVPTIRVPVEIQTPSGGTVSVGGSVPALASGGIVRRPTLALVGESGPEAVVPLSALSGASGGNQTIVLELDGRAVARVVVPLIPGEVKRYGLV